MNQTINNEENNVMTFIENFITLTIIVSILFTIISLFGMWILKLCGYQSYHMLYNFVFGLGIIATITFCVAVVEEMRR